MDRLLAPGIALVLLGILGGAWFYLRPLDSAPRPIWSDAAEYMDGISGRALREHVQFLASDDLGGRYVGTLGIETAARYIADSYREIGVASPGRDDFRQRFRIFHERPSSVRFRILSGSATTLDTHFGRDTDVEAYPVSGNVRSGSFEVIFAGYGIEDDTLGYNDYESLVGAGVNLAGKWVLVFENEPAVAGDSSGLWPGGTAPTGWTTRQLYEKRGAASRAGGAEGLLIISDSADDMQSFDERASAQARAWELAPAPMSLDRDPIPASMPMFVFVSTKFANALLATADRSAESLQRQIIGSKRPASFALPGATLRIDAPRNRPSVEAFNIVAVIEGSDLRSEFIVVSSHYDHHGKNPLLDGDQIFNGAADDASGVAGSLEIARAFGRAKDDGKGPRRSIMFLNTSAEERGILGSAYFADRNPLVPLSDVVANVNLDGIGGFDSAHPEGGYIYVIESDVLGANLTDVVSEINAEAGLNVRLETGKDFNSDHLSFASYLIPYVYLSTGFTEHYHKPSDEAQTLDYDHLASVTRLAFGTVWRLANDEGIVPRERAVLLGRIGFQCPPCGVTPHDDHVHDAPGYCPTCGMRLVAVEKMETMIDDR